MRLHFQERPWDLYVTEAYTAGMAALLLIRNVGLLPAILLVLFVPGYALVAALFPSKEEIDWIERIALSFGLSIAVVPLLGLLLNFTFGIFFQPIVLTILIFTEGMAAVAHLRRIRLPVEERLTATIDLQLPAWREYSNLDKALTLGLVASIVFSASVLAYVVTTPRPGERFTEYFILDANGRAENYPADLNVSEEGTVIIGVVNHEFETVGYTVKVDLVGVEIVWNESSGFNETVELNRSTLRSFDFPLDHDANWSQVFTFSIDSPGLWKVEFLLYKDGILTNLKPQLFVRVAEG